MYFVNNIDFETRPTWSHIYVLPQITNIFDAPITGAIDLDHIHIFARRNALTNITAITWFRRWAFTTVKRLGQDSRRRSLTDSTSACKQVSVTNTICLNRVSKCPNNRCLPYQIFEGLWSVAPRHNDILIVCIGISIAVWHVFHDRLAEGVGRGLEKCLYSTRWPLQ